MHLYTFALSHYAEKARWGLDRSGLAYREVHLIPGLHLAWMKRHGLPRTYVPVLELPDRRGADRFVQGSGAILDWLEQAAPGRLTGDDPERDRAFEERLDLDLGRTLRQILYFRLLETPDALPRLWGTNRRSRWFVTLALPLLRRGLIRKYRLHADAVAEAEPRFEAAWTEVEAELAGRPWFSGARFGRADLAASALLGPLVCPPGHPFDWPPRPPAVEAFAARYRGRPLWNHVERCYREARGPTGPRPG